MTDLTLYEGGNLSSVQKKFNWIAENVGDSRPSFLDSNYLKLLIHENQELKPEYIVKFLHMAYLTGADPRINQIYLLIHNKKNQSTQQWEKVSTPVFSYHFFLKQANLSGEFKGMNVSSALEEVFDPIKNEEGKQLVATAKIFRKNAEIVTFKARWNEFVQTKKSGDITKQWAEKPYVMLEKCAIANGIRWQFPEAMSNMYIQEEIHETTDEDKVIQAIDKDNDDAYKANKTEDELEIGHEEYINPIRKFATRKNKDIGKKEFEERLLFLTKRTKKESYVFDQYDFDEIQNINIYLDGIGE